MSQNNKNEDNPVPSIETLIDEFFEKNQKYSDVKCELAQYINTKRQNGVETYKEEPELTVSGKKMHDRLRFKRKSEL